MSSVEYSEPRRILGGGGLCTNWVDSRDLIEDLRNARLEDVKVRHDEFSSQCTTYQPTALADEFFEVPWRYDLASGDFVQCGTKIRKPLVPV